MRVEMLVLLIGLSNLAQAQSQSQGQITLPWQEFEAFYQKSLKQQQAAETQVPAPFLYTLDAVAHRLSLEPPQAAVQMQIQGRVLSGAYQSIPLLNGDLAFTGIPQTAGVSLIREAQGYALLPSAPAFQATLQLLLPIQEDRQSQYVRWPVPTAVQNRLQLSLPAHYHLLDAPGQAQGDFYYFPPSQELLLRFVEKTAQASVLPLEFELLSVLSLQGQRVLLDLHCLPLQTPDRPVQIQLPTHCRYLGSSLPASALKVSSAGLEVSPNAIGNGFNLQCVLTPDNAGLYQATLPHLADNSGHEGNLVLAESEAGRITLTGEYPALPVSRLPTALRTAVSSQDRVLQVPDKGVVQFNVQSFASVAAPAVVLDEVRFYAAFEDSGAMLAVLQFKVPPSAGPRLSLQPVPGAKIWSLLVNDQKKGVYTLEDGRWIIPLAHDQTSSIELTYLVQSQKLGLQGRLETQLPGLGLPAHRLYVGLALPNRVELLSVEADVAPDTDPSADKTWKTPSGFIGKPYFFSRAFYTGETLPVAISYKEPVGTP